jgi:hypothetical protein
MGERHWEDLRQWGHVCWGLNDSKIDHIANDDYVVISQPGSRIVIDGMQRMRIPGKYCEI